MNNVRTYDSVVARHVLGLILVALFPMQESRALTDPVWYHFRAGAVAFTTPKARWSTNVRTPTPFRKFLAVSGSNRRYAGPFGNQRVRIALDSLPPHSHLVVETLVYILGSWDGNADGDRLSIVVDGRDTLLHSTFSNTTLAQSYPRRVGSRAANPRWSGAADTNVTGFRFTEANVYDGPLDAAYRLRFVVPHGRDSAVLDFIGVLEDVRPTVDNEAWGIASLRITPEGRPHTSPRVAGTLRNADEPHGLSGNRKGKADDIVVVSCFDSRTGKGPFTMTVDTDGTLRLWNDRTTSGRPLLDVNLNDEDMTAMEESVERISNDPATIGSAGHGDCSIVVGAHPMDFTTDLAPSLQRIRDILRRILRDNGLDVLP